MEKIKTAIVILNWNGEKLLKQFLPSVVEHSSSPDTQIIVADNGSTDNSLIILQNEFPSVRILDLKQNFGFAKGYNEALKQIDAEYYVLLNSDVEVTKNWLQHPVELFDADAAVGVIQPKIKSHLQKDSFEYAGAAGGFIDRYGYIFCRGRIFDFLEKDQAQYDKPTDIFWASGACMFIRSEVFYQAGGFDERFWAHMEEIDLCWRIKNLDYRVLFCPQSVVFHLGGGSLPYDNPKKLYLNFRNNLSMLYKNLPTGKLLPTLFARMVMDALAAFRLLTEKNVYGFFSVVRAHLSFYKNIPYLQRSRNRHSLILKRKMFAEIFPKSIVWQYYGMGKKRFSQLNFDDF